jgi:hypothetical protein
MDVSTVRSKAPVNLPFGTFIPFHVREFQTLGDRDYGGIDDAQGKAHVLLNEFRGARDVAFPDRSNMEAVAAE